MPPFEIRQAPPQAAAIVQVSCPVSEIAAVMGPTFEKVVDAVTRSGGVVTGPAFARYREMSPERVEFDCGMGVASPYDGEGDVKPAQLGGCEAAYARHVGPYETVGETWNALTDWVHGQGRELQGPGWESYLTDPEAEPDPTKWVTEVWLPLKSRAA
jgi:effector-binding domain-containing protein